MYFRSYLKLEKQQSHVIKYINDEGLKLIFSDKLNCYIIKIKEKPLKTKQNLIFLY